MKTETKAAKMLLRGCLCAWVVVIVAFAYFDMGFDYCTKGLALNAIGIIISFLFSFADPVSIDCLPFIKGVEGGTSVKFEGREIAADDCLKILDERIKLNKLWAYMGLAYLLAGAVFQIAHQLLVR